MFESSSEFFHRLDESVDVSFHAAGGIENRNYVDFAAVVVAACFLAGLHRDDRFTNSYCD